MTKRITISVPDEIADKAQRAADTRKVESVSAYFVELAEREPDWAAAEAVVEQVLDEIGGVSAEDEEWVDSALTAEGSDVPYAA